MFKKSVQTCYPAGLYWFQQFFFFFPDFDQIRSLDLTRVVREGFQPSFCKTGCEEGPTECRLSKHCKDIEGFMHWTSLALMYTTYNNSKFYDIVILVSVQSSNTKEKVNANSSLESTEFWCFKPFISELTTQARHRTSLYFNWAIPNTDWAAGPLGPKPRWAIRVHEEV